MITTSIQDIQLNPQDTSNFYLANIQQALTDPNPSNISLPSSPPPFHPPSSAIWVNSLWVLSLVINLTCAILANLLQQWARRYLEVTQTRYSLHKRARIRAFYAEGVQKFLLPWVFEALPAMLHLSVFFFFAGLIVFLWNFDPTISKLVLSWVGICTALYGCTTIIPIFRHDSPYYTPFTPLARLVAVVILHVSLILRNCFIFLLCTCTCYGSCCYPILRCLSWDRRRGSITQILDSTLMTAEEAALMTSSEIDARAFMWTFDRLEEDHELERFFTGLPGFRSSKVIEDPLPILSNWEKQKISESLIGFLDLTFSSTFLPEAVKSQRAIIAAKALDLAEFPQGSGNRLRDTIFRACYRGPRTANHSPHLGDIKDENTIFVQAIFTAIVARQQQRDDSWFRHVSFFFPSFFLQQFWFRQVAPNALGIPEAVLRDYDGSGHSLSLAMLIHVTRQQLTYFQHPTWPTYEFAAVLEEASKFNVQDTSPELQHEFCALWNEIVLKARTGDRRIAGSILRYIRGIYIILHRSTDSAPSRFAASTKKFDGILENPFSYPVCNVPNHALNDSTTTSIAQTVPHENAPLVPASLGSPDTPSSAIPAPFQVDKRPIDVPPHDNSHNSHITDPTAGTVRIPLTSPDRAHAGAVQNTDSSGITMPRSTPETPTSAPPRSSTFPPTAFPLQHHANTLSPSNQPNPSFMASNLVLDNTLSTGLLLSSHFTVT